MDNVTSGRFVCPNRDCKTVLQVKTRQATKRLTCPKCGAEFTVSTRKDLELTTVTQPKRVPNATLPDTASQKVPSNSEPKSRTAQKDDSSFNHPLAIMLLVSAPIVFLGL